MKPIKRQITSAYGCMVAGQSMRERAWTASCAVRLLCLWHSVAAVAVCGLWRVLCLYLYSPRFYLLIMCICFMLSLRAVVREKLHLRVFWPFVLWSTERDGLVCSSECTSSGCWGGDDDQCLSCRNYAHGGLCVTSCGQSPGLFTVNGTSECSQCHEQCKDMVNACSGPVRKRCVLICS